jgi:site-specific recombinase XerD
MSIRNLTDNTKLSYIQQVGLYAKYFHRSPDLLGPPEVREYQVYLTMTRKLSASSISTATSALRFLYRVTLKQHWSPDGIPMPKKPLKLPVVLSPVEVMHFLDCIENLKHRALLMTAYAAMAGNFGTSMAYQAACALVFNGLEHPL